MKKITIIEFARKQRANPTPAEKEFWQKVRKKSFHGFKFYRQYPIKYKLISNQNRYFIADFYCHRNKLIIELDGGIHFYQQGYDLDRSNILKSIGYKIIRFNNEDVFFSWDVIENKLLDILNN
jgi:very-short-patch-repair endonuclease